jgi:beta-lactamase superfamily II metal-dependent hydrolase
MNIKVTFLDVFHGDCAVVTFDEGDSTACIVVDGGETKAAAKRLACYLKHEGIEIIDLMVATHIDADHVQGLVKLLEHYSGSSSSWNGGEQRCIRYYWGPQADPDYVEPQTASVSASAVAAQSGVGMLDYVMQSVKQNQRLHELIEEHIIDAGNIYFPSLDDPPPLDIFENIEMTLLAPDTQIDDTDLKSKALIVSNAPYRSKIAEGEVLPPGTRLTLEDLKRIVAMNGEEMGTIANRTANNQSIVFKLTPAEGSSSKAKDWTFLFTGDAEHESWEMMNGREGIKESLPSRVLKVPHHGSVNGIDKGSFMTIKPKYSIVSVGQKHGIPDGDTLHLIRKNKKRYLFCTERNAKSNGSCWDAHGDTMAGCVRSSESRFRSISFEIDTDTGDESIDVFAFNSSNSEIKAKTGDRWCGASGWETS